MKIKINKNNFINIIIISLIILLPFLFFYRLFYPNLNLLFTPDLNRSDIFDIQYALKDFLSQSLKQHQLPLWSNLIATGFPILAEGQIGTFYLPNLILFYFLPTPWAFNLSIILTFILAQLGMYFFAKEFKLNKFISFYLAFVFAFSGFFLSHLRHLNMIQATSLFPWLFWLFFKFKNSRKVKYLLIFSFVLSQQIFTGHFQIVFFTLLAIFSYLTLKIIFSENKKKLLRIIGLIFLTTIFGLLLAGIQLFPTLELTKLSVRKNGLEFDKITEFSYPYKSLLMFLNPFFAGNPYNGTYNNLENIGIFWENNFYLGIISFIFFIASFFFKKLRSKKKIYYFIIGFYLLIAFGKDSPFYLIYTLKPFKFFRITSRYVFISTFFMILIAGLLLKKIANNISKQWGKKVKTAFLILIITLSLADFSSFNHKYTPVYQSSKELLEKPESLNFISSNSRYWLCNEAHYAIWYSLFKKGWKNLQTFYFLRNNLGSYSNLIWNIETINLLRDNSPLYSSYYNTLIEKSTLLKGEGLYISPLAVKIFTTTSVDHIITPVAIQPVPDELELINIISSNTLPPLYTYIYRFKTTMPQFYFTKKIVPVQTIVDFLTELMKKSFQPQQTSLVVAENKDIFDLEFDNQNQEIKVLEAKNTLLKFRVKNSALGFLVINKSFYPGWQAIINNKPTEIYLTNLNQQGIIVPRGENNITLKYNPLSFRIGSIISFVALLSWALGYVLFANKSLKID